MPGTPPARQGKDGEPGRSSRPPAEKFSAFFFKFARRQVNRFARECKTTPDAYPLSLNALTTGANQKSNRDPVLSLNDDQVLETLPALQTQGMVTRIQGGRVERWRHNLYELWKVGKVELAVLAELLL